MSRDFPTEHVDPPVEECGRVGGGSAEDAALRLAFLIEARQQMEMSGAYGFGDVLYRAHYNARFVIEGRTPKLQLRDQSVVVPFGQPDVEAVRQEIIRVDTHRPAADWRA